MDYYTKPVKRIQLRKFACLFRQLFEIGQNEKINVLEVLDKFHSVFENASYVVLEDYEMPPNIPARCLIQENEGTFRMEIKNTVYEGAYKKKVGAFLDFICHEMCHVFLYIIGYTPTMNRSFDNGKIPAYCSVEWQAKALCGEIMMPYEATKNMSIEEIMKVYGVSRASAEFRKRY